MVAKQTSMKFYINIKQEPPQSNKKVNQEDKTQTTLFIARKAIHNLHNLQVRWQIPKLGQTSNILHVTLDWLLHSQNR